MLYEFICHTEIWKYGGDVEDGTWCWQTAIIGPNNNNNNNSLQEGDPFEDLQFAPGHKTRHP